MTPRQAIETMVDGLVQKGAIPQSERQNYINTLAANDTLAQEVASSILRQEDYSRKTMQVADERRKLDEERARIASEEQRYRQELETWQAGAQAELARLKDIERRTPEVMAKIAAYEQTLRDYNLLDGVQLPSEVTSPKQWQAAPQPQPYQTPVQTKPDPNVLTRDEATKVVQELLSIQGKAMSISARHQQLFGAPLVDDIVSESMATGQDLEQLWRTKYGVDSRQAQIAEEQKAKERAQLEQELRQQIMAEVANDPSRVFAPGHSGQPTGPGLLDQYMAGAARSANPVLGEQQQQSISPEKQSPLGLSNSRITEAAKFFAQNYGLDGSPLVGGGPAQAPK